MIVGEARLEPGLRIYAIGDVHGCIAQLRELIEHIDQDVSASPVEEHRIVFLGDYVDRGPANREVVEYLIELEASQRDCVFLLGNHDDKFLGLRSNPDAVAEGFLRWGGVATLRDYGIIQEPGESIARLSVRFAEAVPLAHFEFLEHLPKSYQAGDYFFCHAGVRPGVALEEQLDHDLLWIRTDFLAHDAPFEKVIVHGHTPHNSPEIRNN